MYYICCLYGHAWFCVLLPWIRMSYIHCFFMGTPPLHTSSYMQFRGLCVTLGFSIFSSLCVDEVLRLRSELLVQLGRTSRVDGKSVRSTRPNFKFMLSPGRAVRVRRDGFACKQRWRTSPSNGFYRCFYFTIIIVIIISFIFFSFSG